MDFNFLVGRESLFSCLHNYITDSIFAQVITKPECYTFTVNDKQLVDRPCFLSAIINHIYTSTLVNTEAARENLSSLAEYMDAIPDSDVAKFNGTNVGITRSAHGTQNYKRAYKSITKHAGNGIVAMLTLLDMVTQHTDEYEQESAFGDYTVLVPIVSDDEDDEQSAHQEISHQ